MLVQDLIKQIDSAAPDPFYLFCPGKATRQGNNYEPLLAEEAVAKLADRLVDPSVRDFAYNLFYADETDLGEILSTAATVPFLAERRVVIVQGVERFESESAGKALHGYLQAPCDTAVLLLVANKIDRRLKLFKVCDKAGAVVECPALTANEAMAWAKAAIQERGKDIGNDALRELIGRTGASLAEIKNAVELVCNYVGSATRISAEDVYAACADLAEDQVWAMTDAIAASDTATAISVLRSILDLGVSEFEVMGTINWLLKSAWATGPGKGNLSPFVAKKVRPLATKLGEAKLRDAFALLMDTEILLRSTGVDRALALELLVLKLAAPRTARRRASA